MKDGTIDGLSISFAPVRDRWSRDRRSVERLEAKLAEISLTPFPVYAGAAIAGVRDGTRSLSAEAARRRLLLLERI